LYQNICRSLFEKDKLLFSFLLASRIKQFKGELNDEDLRFLLTGGISLSNEYPSVPSKVEKWLVPADWQMFVRLSQMTQFKGILDKFEENADQFEKIFQSPTP
jgi:dynein heavy chain